MKHDRGEHVGKLPDSVALQAEIAIVCAQRRYHHDTPPYIKLAISRSQQSRLLIEETPNDGAYLRQR